MKFQINVYGAPWTGNSARSAQQFIQHSLDSGHDIARVFFFFDGVYHGLNTQSPASDEFDLLSQWQALSDRGVELLLCIAASANRGLLDDAEAKRYDKSAITVARGFSLTGLGQWASGFHDADRLITFK
ncbi:sulfurtransferase complex subunit TusD [Reinekea blandensis]|uniref:Uncharacterized protein n=1 Tax=Reinekea blandensis MED297 TaxID=314283 RepID=A4BDR4_9GAMM|nr:sulfurtransferase complex subunit TusD [Reinekea blandensis]EAR09673.1 hypothetical protein MED297_15979 [Reinekea blandensis MED297]